MTTRSGQQRRPLPTSPFQARVEPPVEDYTVDDRVSHDTYGLGRVVSVQGDQAVVVDFAGRRVRIVTPYAKLYKL